MKKKLLLIVGIIVALFIGLISYYVIIDLKQEDILLKELDEINMLSNESNIDIDKIYNMLDRTVTKDDYAKVERAFKNYLKDSFDNILKISSILEDDRLVNILTAQNYINDGKDFINTKEYIESTINNLKAYKEEYINYFTEEKVMSYVYKYNLDSYYVDLYKNEFVGDIESQTIDKTVENSIDEVLDFLNLSNQVIDLLRYNQDSWYIEEDMIVFNDDKLSNEYDNLINSI